MTPSTFISSTCHLCLKHAIQAPAICIHHHPPKRRYRSNSPIVCVSSAASAASVPEPNYDQTSAYNSPPSPSSPPIWQQIGECDVLLPPSDPVATAVFIGGLGAGINPPTFYGNLLRRISESGSLAIVCARLSPIPSTDHLSLSHATAKSLSSAISALPPSVRSLPLIGMGHSLGSKLLLLASIDSTMREDLPLKACIFMSFNNSRLRQALPIDAASGFLNSFVDGVDNMNIPGAFGNIAKNTVDSLLRTVQDTLSSQQDFTPNPEATLAIAGARYHVRHNLVISFHDDDIDDGADLTNILKSRFGQSGNVMQRGLPGTHLTPVAPDFANSSFSSLGNSGIDDAVRRAGLGVTKEVDATVAVIVAFVRLYLQVRESR